MESECLFRHVLLEAIAFTLNVIGPLCALMSRRRCGPPSRGREGPDSRLGNTTGA